MRRRTKANIRSQGSFDLVLVEFSPHGVSRPAMPADQFAPWFMSSFADIAHLGKYLTAWAVMLLVSVANGAVRDLTYGKRVTELTAHQISTATGMLLLGAVIWIFDELVSPASGLEAAAAGLFWVTLTVMFEFLFFHYVGGQPWARLLADYDLLKGRVWSLLLIWIALAPYLFFRMRHSTWR